MPIQLILFSVLLAPFVVVILIGLVPLTIMLGGGFLYDRISLWWQKRTGNK